MSVSNTIIGKKYLVPSDRLSGQIKKSGSKNVGSDEL
jgi:hypothetical protein